MNRKEQLERISADNKYDIIIIGGGATGLGCAVDAAIVGAANSDGFVFSGGAIICSRSIAT